MNDALQEFARAEIKDGLSRLEEGPRTLFAKMYGHPYDPETPINDVVDAMPAEKLDWAMEQVRRTFEKRASQEQDSTINAP